jgi:hypothetical protein
MTTRSRFLLLLPCLACFACTDPVVPPAETADAAAADADATADVPDTQAVDALSVNGDAVDAQPSDVAVTDVQFPDAAPDVKDIQPSDIQATDSGPDIATGCSALLAQIDALKPKLTPCGAGATCQVFEYPICNTMGCFQTPVASNADTSALASLTQQAGAAQCPGFHCGCGPYAPAFCLNSQCQQCPPNCDGTCDELTAALLTTAHAENWCGIDKDCQVISTGLCPVGDLPCGGLYVSQNTNQDNLQAIIGGYSKACGASFCKCAVPGPAKCVKGKCVAG